MNPTPLARWNPSDKKLKKTSNVDKLAKKTSNVDVGEAMKPADVDVSKLIDDVV